jgi:hypothetical protein
MDPIVWQYIGYFAGPLVLILLGLLLWKRREQRRTKAVKLAATFRDWKLDDLADLCLAYSIGNYLGTDSVTRISHKIIDRLEHEGAAAVFRSLGWKMADVFIANPDDLKELQKRIAAALALAGTAAVALAPLAGPAAPAVAAAGLAATGLEGVLGALKDRLDALDAKVHTTALATPAATAGQVVNVTK